MAAFSDPFSFTIDGLDLNFKVDYSDGYTLRVNETYFEDLVEFKEVAEIPKVAHSVKDEYQGANSKRIDFYPFLDGSKTPISLEHNMRSAQLTLDVDGKP